MTQTLELKAEGAELKFMTTTPDAKHVMCGYSGCGREITGKHEVVKLTSGIYTHFCNPEHRDNYTED